MSSRNYVFHDSKSGAAIHVRVIPRSFKNEIGEILDDGVVKIRLKAAPVGGKANEMLIDFLSKILDVRKVQINLVAGHTKKDKLVSILGVDTAYVQRKLTAVIKSGSSKNDV